MVRSPPRVRQPPGFFQAIPRAHLVEPVPPSPGTLLSCPCSHGAPAGAFPVGSGGEVSQQDRRQWCPGPLKKVSLFSLVDLLLDALYNLVLSVLGDKSSAALVFPFAAGLFVVILLSDLLGVVPGMDPPTAHLQLNLAMALSVFFFTHYVGVRRHGAKYLKQFTGDFWPLAPLMIVLEIISHIARPISLTIRLLGNMFADHKVIAIFTFLVPLLLPVPFLFLGILVSVLQAFVFTLLSVIYFSMALADDH